MSEIRRSQNTRGKNDVDLNGVTSKSAAVEEAGVDIAAAASAGHRRSPLKERQPTQEQIRQESVSSDEPASPVIIPKLVPRKAAVPGSVHRARTGEPELPPTPIELGVTMAPERPRGLASSSSPRVSKSGSRRRGTRSGGPSTSSPLKPKSRPSAQAENGEADKEAAAQEVVREALESELELPQQEDEDDPTELREQRAIVESLQEQMERLQRDIQQLQGAIDLETPSEEVLALLRESAAEDGSLDKGKQGSISAYLNLFAPGNLQLTSRTETKVVDERTKIIHTIRVEAPPPWLPNALSCIFDVMVDAENVQVEGIEIRDSTMAVTRRTRPTASRIQTWAQIRTQSPLYGLDVGGMIGGIGRWFDAAVERAKVYHWIDQEYNRAALGKDDQNDGQANNLTREVCIELARHLDSSQHTAVDADLTVLGTRQVRKKMMLNWEIKLDWTGDVKSDIQISTTGIPRKAEPEMRTIFSGLLPKIGVKGAFTNAWNLIHTEGDEIKLGVATERGKRKRKR